MNTYATCSLCGRPMAPGGTCEGDAVIRWGEEIELALRAQLAYQRGEGDPFVHPVPIDDPELDAFMRTLHIGPYVQGDCPDCNCRIGGVHHIGCDREECATCHRQRLTCECA